MAKLSACGLVMLVLLTALNEKALARFCCTSYQKEKGFPVNRLKNYIMQENTGNCNIRAVIFLTVKGRFFCANPEHKWVVKAMETLNKKH